MFSLTLTSADTLLNVFLAIAVDNLANAQELTKVQLVGGCFSGKVNHLFVANQDHAWHLGTGTGSELLPWMHCAREKAPPPHSN